MIKLLSLVIISVLMVGIHPAEAGKSKVRRDAGTFETRVITHNIAGGAIYKGTADALAPVERNIDTYNPHIVLLQEVCGSQYQWFKNQHTDWAFTGAVRRYDHPDCPGVDKDLYDVVASRANQSNKIILNLYREPLPRTGKMPCADVNIRDGRPEPVHACSAHFPVGWGDVDGTKHAAAVAGTVAHLRPKATAGQPIIFGGDMNRVPSDPALDPIYNLLVESTDGQPTTGGVNGTKIDYVFRKHLGGQTYSRSNENGSDHNLVYVSITGSKTLWN